VTLTGLDGPRFPKFRGGETVAFRVARRVLEVPGRPSAVSIWRVLPSCVPGNLGGGYGVTHHDGDDDGMPVHEDVIPWQWVATLRRSIHGSV